MNYTALFQKTVVAAGISAVLPCLLFAQEHATKDASSDRAAPAVSELGVDSESLMRADFPGLKSWARIEKGSKIEGRLTLPLYAGERVAAPAESTIRVTVGSVKKIRPDLGFWRKTGRGIVRAFNPLETSRPAEYRVELSAADFLLPTGEVVPLDAHVLRASSGVMVQASAGPLQTTAPMRERGKPSAVLLLGLRPEAALSVRADAIVEPATSVGEQGVARAYLLTALRASVNHPGDTFRAQLAEPLRAGSRVFASGTMVEGTVTRSVAPKMLSRAGRLYLRVDRILPADGEPLRLAGSLSAAEADAQARFSLDEEGTLHGRAPGIVNGLVDLGYAYAVGKISDDISETPIRALGASISDAAVANAARYVGLGTSLAFLITRHGRDVFLPRYSLIEIEIGRVSETPSASRN